MFGANNHRSYSLRVVEMAVTLTLASALSPTFHYLCEGPILKGFSFPMHFLKLNIMCT